MKLLLDTNAFIWWDSNSAKLSRIAYQAIMDPLNERWFSTATIWEMQVKSSIGKLSLRSALDQIIADQLNHAFLELPIQTRHVLRLNLLPAIHRDPFDRILAAQSISEGMVLVTADAVFAKYPVKVLW
jgi:PIN domain nuclease of toxin-antitoxin system